MDVESATSGRVSSPAAAMQPIVQIMTVMPEVDKPATSQPCLEKGKDDFDRMLLVPVNC